jgi:hypothetical protein
VRDEDLLERLKGGDRRSIGRVPEVVAEVLANPGLFGSLFRAMNAADPLVRMRAADAVEKITVHTPAILRPYKKDLIDIAETATQQEVRWHVAQLLSRRPGTARCEAGEENDEARGRVAIGRGSRGTLRSPHGAGRRRVRGAAGNLLRSPGRNGVGKSSLVRREKENLLPAGPRHMGSGQLPEPGSLASRLFTDLSGALIALEPDGRRREIVPVREHGAAVHAWLAKSSGRQTGAARLEPWPSPSRGAGLSGKHLSSDHVWYYV